MNLTYSSEDDFPRGNILNNLADLSFHCNQNGLQYSLAQTYNGFQHYLSVDYGGVKFLTLTNVC